LDVLLLFSFSMMEIHREVLDGKIGQTATQDLNTNSQKNNTIVCGVFRIAKLKNG